MKTNDVVLRGVFFGGEIEPGTFHGGEIEPGTFHGGEIEPGTFHGGEIEPGTFHSEDCPDIDAITRPVDEWDDEAAEDAFGCTVGIVNGI